MFVPFISRRRSPQNEARALKVTVGRRSSTSKLDIRAGGGGRGGGGGGGGGRGGGGGGSEGEGGGVSGSGSGSGSKGGSSGSSGSSGSGGSTSVNTNSGLGSRPASVSSSGGGPITTIPGGSPFAGRSAGGGTRDQIYGTRSYGSGYPGVVGGGTLGRGFPFYFWPVVWWDGPGYLHPDEYGTPDNSTRPGGALSTAAFTNDTTTLRILSDDSTVSILIDQITGFCDSFIQNPSSITSSPYTNSSSSLPRPEQAIQYYRASSIVLSLDGYNDTNVLSANDSNTQDTPLPSGINMDFVNCVNSTIGNAAPLVDTSTSGALAWSPPSTAGLVSLAWLLWIVSAMV